MRLVWDLVSLYGHKKGLERGRCNMLARSGFAGHSSASGHLDGFMAYFLVIPCDALRRNSDIGETRTRIQ